MKRDLNQDLETLYQLLTTCVNTWRMGYDAAGYQSFVQSVDHLEFILEEYFARIQDHLEPLTLMLEKLDQFVQQKDIMMVQDVVEYEWLPLIQEWRMTPR